MGHRHSRMCVTRQLFNNFATSAALVKVSALLKNNLFIFIVIFLHDVHVSKRKKK